MVTTADMPHTLGDPQAWSAAPMANNNNAMACLGPWEALESLQTSFNLPTVMDGQAQAIPKAEAYLTPMMRNDL